MKVYYFIIIAIGLMWTFSLAGIDTNSNQILNAISANDLGNIQSSFFWGKLLTIFALGAAGAIIIGIFGRADPFQIVIAALMSTTFALFAWDMVSIVTLVRGLTLESYQWVYYLVWAIVIPLTVGFFISLLEFIRGSD